MQLTKTEPNPYLPNRSRRIHFISGPYYPPNWEELRQKQFAFDNYTCKGCGITKEQLAHYGLGHLECHHINTGPPDYFHPGGKEEVGVNLITFCRRCHERITDSVREQTYILAPRKRVDAAVTETRQSTGLQPKEHAPLEIVVKNAEPQAERISASRIVEIRLFND